MTVAGTKKEAAAPACSGLLVEFDSPGALLTAAEQVREAGYRRWDTHSPFPVHGIDAAMGIRPTRLPWLIFIAGVVGCLTGVILQWWTNATNATQFPMVPTVFQGYDFVISDKPKWSLPANIPVIFELTVLFAASAAVVGMLAANNLPLWSRALFARPRFRCATRDRFFLVIEATDRRFEASRTAAFLASLNGGAVERIEHDGSAQRLPRPLVLTGIVLACIALLPPLVAARARVSKSVEPRIQPVRDMGKQPRFVTQQPDPLFADGRELRTYRLSPSEPVDPRVARGDLREDAHLSAGRVGVGGAAADGKGPGEWATTFPRELTVDEHFVRRGQQRFGVYCAPCHGLGGSGDGTVARRAQELNTPGWVQPTSLLDQTVIERPVGHIFNTITNGIRTMPPYGDQIPEQDRWAIISYVRALERSQHATVQEVPAELRSELR